MRRGSDDKSEQAILHEALVAGSALPDTLIYRNNTGKAWAGQRVPAATGRRVLIEPGMVVLRNARPVSFGLEGSGDIMGVSRGKPVAGEAKTRIGRQSDGQVNFQRRWEQCGGVYILFRSAAEFTDELATIG